MSEKTIKVKEETYNELNKLGNVTDSFDDVIRRLLNFYKMRKFSEPQKMSLREILERIHVPIKQSFNERGEVKEDLEKQLENSMKDILSLGNDIRVYIPDKDTVIFYKIDEPLVKFRMLSQSFWTYLPDLNEKDGWGHAQVFKPHEPVGLSMDHYWRDVFSKIKEAYQKAK